MTINKSAQNLNQEENYVFILMEQVEFSLFWGPLEKGGRLYSELSVISFNFFSWTIIISNLTVTYCPVFQFYRAEFCSSSLIWFNFNQRLLSLGKGRGGNSLIYFGPVNLHEVLFYE